MVDAVGDPMAVLERLAEPLGTKRELAGPGGVSGPVPVPAAVLGFEDERLEAVDLVAGLPGQKALSVGDHLKARRWDESSSSP